MYHVIISKQEPLVRVEKPVALVWQCLCNAIQISFCEVVRLKQIVEGMLQAQRTALSLLQDKSDFHYYIPKGRHQLDLCYSKKHCETCKQEATLVCKAQ